MLALEYSTPRDKNTRSLVNEEQGTQNLGRKHRKKSVQQEGGEGWDKVGRLRRMLEKKDLASRS